MTNVIKGQWGQTTPSRPANGGGIDKGGGPPDDGGMDRLEHLEKRVDAIEGRLGRIESDMSSLKDGMADVKVALAGLDAKLDIGSVRASVEKAHTDIYKWVASLALGAIVLGLSVYFGVQRISQQIATTPPAHMQGPTPTVPPPPPSKP